MKKSYKVGNRSMDKNEYDKFVSLSKEKQLDIVYNDLSPKNMKQAEELLKNVPNGDNISKGSAKPTEGDNSNSDTRGSNQAGSKGRGANT